MIYLVHKIRSKSAAVGHPAEVVAGGRPVPALALVADLAVPAFTAVVRVVDVSVNCEAVVFAEV